jgi:hypothetical protein
MSFLYLCHPPARHRPDLVVYVRDAMAGLAMSEAGRQYHVITTQYESDYSLRLTDFRSRVMENRGPVVLLHPRTTTELAIVDMLGTAVVVTSSRAQSPQDLLNCILVVIRQAEDGHPKLARRLIVAFLLMRKLDQEGRWAGNSKGYMWAEDIPKGRGLDEEFADQVKDVISILRNQGYLIYKTSQHTKKYALNPTRREEIYQVLRTRRFDDRTQAALLKDPELVSVRRLDLLDSYLELPRRS